MEALGFHLKQVAVRQTLTADVDIGALKPAGRNIEGVVEMMLDATRTGTPRFSPRAAAA